MVKHGRGHRGGGGSFFKPNTVQDCNCNRSLAIKLNNRIEFGKNGFALSYIHPNPMKYQIVILPLVSENTFNSESPNLMYLQSQNVNISQLQEYIKNYNEVIVRAINFPQIAEKIKCLSCCSQISEVLGICTCFLSTIPACCMHSSYLDRYEKMRAEAWTQVDEFLKRTEDECRLGGFKTLTDKDA